jgi:CheY-like chemotaxis protein
MGSSEDYTNLIPPQILIVDKRTDSHAMFRATLGVAGFRSVVVVPKDALRHVGPEQPAACIVRLDAVDSGEWMLIQRLKANPTTRQIPMVVLMDRLKPPVALTMLRAIGCAAILSTPYEAADVMDVLWSVLGNEGRASESLR